MRRKPSLGVCVLASLVGAAFTPSSVWSADAIPDSGSIDVHATTAADGQYLAIALRARDLPAQPISHDHVILIDTSASQVGEHRQQGLAVLRETLSQLPANDRVAVYAVDLKAVPLTEGLVAPGVALTEALPQLESRFPAGATDLLSGVRTAQSQLTDQRPGSILIIGDGMSTARLIQSADLQSALDELVSRRIAVHSYAVGSNTDLQLLGILALRTGGVVVRDDEAADAASAGRTLARALDLPVYHPETIRLESSGLSLLPDAALPLRGDRDTVYLARGEIAAGDRIVVSGQIDQRDAMFAWTVPAPKQTQGNAFLKGLWQRAEQTGGLTNGLAGRDMIAAAQENFQDVVGNLEQQAEQALAAGRNDDAARIGQQIQQVDPANIRAATFVNPRQATPVRTIAQAEQPADPGVPPADPAPAVDNTLPEREGPPAVVGIEGAIAAQAVRTQKLRTEVEASIDQSRRAMATQPEDAREILERMLGVVKAATDVEPEARAELIRVLGAELEQAAIAMEESLKRQQNARQRSAMLAAQQQLLDSAMQTDQKTKELVDRVRALVVQGWEGNPDSFVEAKAVARMIESSRPDSAVGIQTVFTTEAALQRDRSVRLRSLRSERFLETLHQVELSHVPFPDEPPVRYPPAAVWQQLTEKRRKWKSVDLHQSSPNEQRIYQALETTTTMEFPANPLKDVVDYLATIHNIPILLDTEKLSEVGINEDQEVSLVISGIKLRSALRILLKNVAGQALDYVIQNEVMTITTQEEAEAALQTRVYPVADLVIPIQPIGGGFGGGGAFGGGGFGGAGGGGGLGGGGFGGGGGFFSVPDPQPMPQQAQRKAAAAPVFDASAIENVKKKPATRR